MRAVLLIALAGCASGGSDKQIDAKPGDAHPADMAIDAPDAAPDAFLCAVAPCTLAPQCGCAADQGCDLNASDPTKNVCRPDTPTGVEGAKCSFNTDCAAGYSCINNSAGKNCERWCASTTDCLAPRGQCVDQVSGPGGALPGAVVCSSNCDPVAATNPLCPTGSSCDIFTSSFNGNSVDVAECRVTGAGTQGAACAVGTPCAAGFSCVNVGGSNKCSHICAPPSNAGCPNSTTCTGFQTPFTVGGTQYGVCL